MQVLPLTKHRCWATHLKILGVKKVLIKFCTCVCQDRNDNIFVKMSVVEMCFFFNKFLNNSHTVIASMKRYHSPLFIKQYLVSQLKLYHIREGLFRPFFRSDVHRQTRSEKTRQRMKKNVYLCGT